MKNSKTVSFKEGDPEIFAYDPDKSLDEAKEEAKRKREFIESLEKTASVVVEYKPCQRSGLSDFFRPKEEIVEEDKVSDGYESDKDESGVWQEVSDEVAAARASEAKYNAIGSAVAGSKDSSQLFGQNNAPIKNSRG